MSDGVNINDELLWALLNTCKHFEESMSVLIGVLRRNGTPNSEVQHDLKQAEESVKLAAGYIEHAQGGLQFRGDDE